MPMDIRHNLKLNSLIIGRSKTIEEERDRTQEAGLEGVLLLAELNISRLIGMNLGTTDVPTNNVTLQGLRNQ